MSTKITYNGKTTELADGYIATLPCKDYKMETDVVVEAPEEYVPTLQAKEVTANGTVTADEGYDGLSQVIVNVPSEEPTLEDITITENGEYTPSGDGYSKVTVNVEAEDSPLPIEVSTEAEMTALLESGEVGGVYKYTGTSGTYENGALYVLEVDI